MEMGFFHEEGLTIPASTSIIEKIQKLLFSLVKTSNRPPAPKEVIPSSEVHKLQQIWSKRENRKHDSKQEEEAAAAAGFHKFLTWQQELRQNIKEAPWASQQVR